MPEEHENDSTLVDPRKRDIAEKLLALRHNPGWLVMLDELDYIEADCIAQICTYTNDVDCPNVEQKIFRLAVRVDDLKWFKARMADLIMQGTTPEERERIERGK